MALKPFESAYNQKSSNEKYQFRRDLRKLVRYYDFVSQVTRMFDEDLHKEYIFSKYLVKLLPPETETMIDIEELLSLEYYKLRETFKGSINLKPDEKGVYEPATEIGGSSKNKKSPLDEIIEKINERFKGDFTDGDRVLIGTLESKILKNENLRQIARTSNPQVFMQGIFPKEFEKIALECYQESKESFESIFNDSVKYNAIMSVLGDLFYREAFKNKSQYKTNENFGLMDVAQN